MPDRSDFSALYRRTLAPLRRYLSRLLGNSGEAEDLAHDAYLRIYSRTNLTTAERPEALLYVTARRLAINRLKRRSISPIDAPSSGLDFELARSPDPGVEEQIMTRQDLRILQTAIDGLPRGCRSVLILRKIELLSHAEIAERLGISVSTVEKQHARALRLLRSALVKTMDGPQGASEAEENREAGP